MGFFLLHNSVYLKPNSLSLLRSLLFLPRAGSTRRPLSTSLADLSRDSGPGKFRQLGRKTSLATRDVISPYARIGPTPLHSSWGTLTVRCSPGWGPLVDIHRNALEKKLKSTRLSTSKKAPRTQTGSSPSFLQDPPSSCTSAVDFFPLS